MNVIAFAVQRSCSPAWRALTHYAPTHPQAERRAQICRFVAAARLLPAPEPRQEKECRGVEREGCLLPPSLPSPLICPHCVASRASSARRWCSNFPGNRDGSARALAWLPSSLSISNVQPEQGSDLQFLIVRAGRQAGRQARLPPRA